MYLKENRRKSIDSSPLFLRSLLLPRLKNGPCQYQVGARTITNRFIEDKLCFSASVSLMINQYDNGKKHIKDSYYHWDTVCSLNIVFLSKILESLPPLPRQHSAAICCTKNYQPIGVTVHSHCVDGFEGLLKRCRRGRGCSELWKNTIFPEHLVFYNYVGFSQPLFGYI